MGDDGRIQVFTETGSYLTHWGSYGQGPGQFRHIYGVAVGDDGVVYVSDSENSRIQMFSSSGAYLGEWGAPGSANGQFKYVNGIALDPAGNVYAADAEGYRIQKFGPLATAADATSWGRLKGLYR